MVGHSTMEGGRRSAGQWVMGGVQKPNQEWGKDMEEETEEIWVRGFKELFCLKLFRNKSLDILKSVSRSPNVDDYLLLLLHDKCYTPEILNFGLGSWDFFG